MRLSSGFNEKMWSSIINYFVVDMLILSYIEFMVDVKEFL